jgi:hypothetical protein
VVKRNDSAGEPVRGERGINATEAEIVRRIFRDFAAGRSPRAVALALNREGVPGPFGRTWGDTTIRGHASVAHGRKRPAAGRAFPAGGRIGAVCGLSPACLVRSPLRVWCGRCRNIGRPAGSLRRNCGGLLRCSTRRHQITAERTCRSRLNRAPATIYVGLIPNSFSCVTAVHSRTLFA